MANKERNKNCIRLRITLAGEKNDFTVRNQYTVKRDFFGSCEE